MNLTTHGNESEPSDDCKLRTVGDKLELHWRIEASSGFSDDPIIAASDYVLPDRPADIEILPWWTFDSKCPVEARLDTT